MRIYCDTTGTPNAKTYGERMLKRKKMGFTAFKMDVTTDFVSDYGIRLLSQGHNGSAIGGKE